MINKFSFFIYILFFIVFVELISDSLSLIRLAQIYNTIEFTRYFVIIPIFFIILYVLINLSKVKLIFFSSYILLVLFFGIIVSILSWQENESLQYSYYFLFSEISTILFAFFCFIFAYNINFTKEKLEKLEKSLYRISYIILIVSTINVIIGYIFSYFYSDFYFSISGKVLLIPICWFLITGNVIKYFFTLLIIMLGGKFGILLSAFIASIFIFKVKFKIRTLFFVFISIFLFIIFILILYSIKDISHIPIIYKINANYNIFNIDYNNLINFGGGRFVELFSVFENFTLIDYIFGKGLGYEYVDLVYGNFIHNVHITPFGLISKFGIVFTVFMYILILYFLLKKIFLENSLVNIFLKSIIWSMLFFSLTEYSFFVNLILWLFLGVLVKINNSRAISGFYMKLGFNSL